jgi:predicted small lipoprotein YifL
MDDLSKIRQSLVRALLIAAFVFSISACGQKGGLYLPDEAKYAYTVKP